MIPKYHINLFWSEPDGAWAADVPDLHSGSAFGDTPAEALAEIEQAIEGWLAVARAVARRRRRLPDLGLIVRRRRDRLPARNADQQQ